MSDLWLSGDPSLQSSSLHLSLSTYIDDHLAAKRKLFVDNGDSFICKFFNKGQCKREKDCPYRHSRSDKPFVCKHWLRGLCKKGADSCESLHIYDLTKMHFCQFMIDYGSCSNVDCLFNHTKVLLDPVDCVWYSRGFCKHGPTCKNRHRKKGMCADYLAGFCEAGPTCELGHPKWALPAEMDAPLPQYDADGALIAGSDQPRIRTLRSLVGMALPADATRPAGIKRAGPQSMAEIQCNACKQMGHMAGSCPNRASSSYDSSSSSYGSSSHSHSQSSSSNRPPRDLKIVQCFKCGELGHYASLCENQKREPPPGGWVLPPGAKPKERYATKRQRE